MPVPDYDMKKPKHVVRFGQQMLLSENIVVLDGPFVFPFSYKELHIVGLHWPYKSIMSLKLKFTYYLLGRV
jgi:hypothetical protein